MTQVDKNGNIIHIEGDTFKLTLFDIKDDGVAFDFTNYKATLKCVDSDDVVLFTLTEATGIALLDGTMILTDPDGIIKALTQGTYYYSLKITDDGGNTDTWFYNKNFIVQ